MFTCPHCQKSLRTKVELPPGKKIKCPSCREIFRLPLEAIRNEAVASTANAVAAPGYGKRRRLDSEDNGVAERPPSRKNRLLDEEDEGPPRRRGNKKATSKRGMILALGGLGLVLVLVAVTGFVWPGFLLSDSPKVQAQGSANLAKDGQKKFSPDNTNNGGKKGPPGGGSSIRKIMTRLARGPNALNNNIGKELKSEAPAWDALPAQTSEYVDLAKSLAEQEPRKGSKESWARFSAEFSAAAVNLNQSVQAKDKAGALAAFASLENSCMACHQAHRGGPGGLGPKGGFGAAQK
jgi:hypothetical protein